MVEVDNEPGILAPLRKLDNVVLTPHLGYVVDEQYRIFYSDAVEDVAAFAAGTPVRVIP